MLVRKLCKCLARFVGTALLLVSQGWSQQTMSSFDRTLAQDILRTVADDVKKHYYDPKLHGVDWDAKVTEAKKNIDKASSLRAAMFEIATVLDSLNDSHTYFRPPLEAGRFDYGLEYQMIGERCFVTQVRPQGDAEAKGVKQGDEVLTLNGYQLTRDNIDKMQYLLYVLEPQPGLSLRLRDVAGSERQVDVITKVHEGQGYGTLPGGGDVFDRIRRADNRRTLLKVRYVEFGDRLVMFNIPNFVFSPRELDDLIGRARRYPALIIDLRGNPGGYSESLKLLLGGLFAKDVKIADRVGRKEAKPEAAKASSNSFSGRLLVLVDAKSASASELFARVVQIERRGTVIGDITSGSVMESQFYTERTGVGRVSLYGVGVTEWNLIMADGRSLERFGVRPDEIVLPSAKDLADGADPVLAHAAKLLGVDLSPEAAGKLFPYEWLPD
jgi:C-terminal processing protease CtpA/Prc